MKPNPAEIPTEVLAGMVERVTFHNEDNGFAVLRVKARGKRDPITVVGHAAVISAGEFIQASGEWSNDRQHGLQFRARFLKAMPPTTIEGIEKYLGSGMIRGIGPVYAKKLARAFGVQVFDIIEAEPERLREVTGIGPKRAEGIVAGWAEQRIIREIMIFLHANGVGTSRAVRIYKTYGNDAVQLISEDPYRLARDIRGIGFRPADAVAMKLGIEKTAMIRARAGISYALTEALDDGHCGLPRDELLPLAVKLLEVPESLIVDALTLELEAGAVIADTVENRPCVFLAGLYRAEQSIAARLRTLRAGRPPWPDIDASKAIPWVEEKTGLTLAKSQKDAVRTALVAKVMVITGWPGGRQDDAGECDPEDSCGEARRASPLRADRTGGQAHDGNHGPGGKNHPSAAGGRSQERQLQAQRREHARLRSARHRRDLHGGCPADERVARA
ncbi:RecD/TraA family predicted helicase [Bradyrhizobium japonicum]